MEENKAAEAEAKKPEEPGTEAEGADGTGKEEDEREATEKAKEELRKTLHDGFAKQRAMIDEANKALAEGKGKLRLETPILRGDREYKELVYDYTVLKGYEYTDAMDSDSNAANNFNITRRQALALFAKAAAKQTEGLDMMDIVSEIGITDSMEAIQSALLFFSASLRAGRMRITRK